MTWTPVKGCKKCGGVYLIRRKGILYCTRCGPQRGSR